MQGKKTHRVIRKVEAIPVAVPLKHPIKWARGQIDKIDNVIVTVTLTDGTQGIAAAPDDLRRNTAVDHHHHPRLFCAEARGAGRV
jgi:L-alanine-DL-glutamate epimerase-like enolase superfamily enzyme